MQQGISAWPRWTSCGKCDALTHGLSFCHADLPPYMVPACRIAYVGRWCASARWPTGPSWCCSCGQRGRACSTTAGQRRTPPPSGRGCEGGPPAPLAHSVWGHSTRGPTAAEAGSYGHIRLRPRQGTGPSPPKPCYTSPQRASGARTSGTQASQGGGGCRIGPAPVSLPEVRGATSIQQAWRGVGPPAQVHTALWAPVRFLLGESGGAPPPPALTCCKSDICWGRGGQAL